MTGDRAAKDAFSERLRAAANSAGISQASIAARLGLPPSTVNQWFTGDNRPRLEQAPALASLLSLTPGFLFFGEQEGDGTGSPSSANDPDADLDALDNAALLAAARAMRRAIRAHRDASGHDLCWHQPDLWALLPDAPAGGQAVPDWPQFMRGCVRYRQSLDAQLSAAPRTTQEFAG